MRYLLSNSPLKTVALIATAGFALLSSLEAQIRYQLVVPQVQGTPINRTNQRGNEINENGETLLNRVATFAVWKDGSLRNIVNATSDYPATLSRVNAASINAYQQAVGSKTYLIRDDQGTRFDTFPFYWDPTNGFVDLDDLGTRSPLGAGSTSLFAINDLGTAIGTNQLFEGETLAGNAAFTWSFEKGRTEIAALDTFESLSFTSPQDVNNSGTVVGTYRRFLDAANHYNERAFLFEENSGPVDLAEIDAAFFSSTHYTARSINNKDRFVGERDRQAYLYDRANQTGYAIESPSSYSGATRAYTLNDNDVVAGATEHRDSAGHLGFSPIIWTRQTGTVDLMPHLQNGLSKILPQGIDSLDCQITPKSINNRGQISASLETKASFSREIILTPTLDFRWSSMTQTSESGVRGILYTHDKTNLHGAIPASAMGFEISFQCSSDMSNWYDIDHQQSGIRLLESDDLIELFVPFSDCAFIRPILEPSSN